MKKHRLTRAVCALLAAATVGALGVGVAGLQAIATAKRLGAVIEASDVRPSVKEQVESLQKDKSFLFKPADNPGKPNGHEPRDSDTNKKEPTTSEDFGKSLAKQKLQMLGIQTEGGN